DVTEAITTGDQLRTYSSALEQVADLVSIIGTDYRFVFVNEAVLHAYGRTRNDVIGRPISELIGKDQFERVSKADLDRCFAGGRVRAEREQRNAAGDLRYLDVKLEPFRKSNGEIVGAIAVMRDVTEATKRHREFQLAKSAIDQIRERIVIVDKEQSVRLVNQSHLDFHGREMDDVLGKHIGELIGWSRYSSEPNRMITQAIEVGIESRHEYWRSNLEGEGRYWETSVIPFREADSTISGAIATSRDMTEHLEAERARRRFQDAIEHLADGYALFDEHERLTAYNESYGRIHAPSTPNFRLGVSFEAIIRGRVKISAIHDAVGREEAWIEERLRSFRSESYIGDFRVEGGRWLHVHNRRTADGGILLMVTDVTESKRIEEALAHSQTRFKDFTDLATDWFWEQDTEGRFSYYSDSFESITGWRIPDILGKTSLETFSQYVMADPTWLALWQEQQSIGIDRTVEFEHDLPTADGRTLRVSTTFRPIKNAAGVIVGYRGAAKNITAAHGLERQLEHQANHDALTGLPNRRSFERHLEQAIRANAEGRRPSTFCFIDLDQFKVVNDTAGHLAGDRLLQQVATLLASKIRKGDVLARLGGDEFGLLMRDCSLRRARNMAKRLLMELNDDRFFDGDSVFEIGASIGVTSIQSTPDSDLGRIMAEADLACYAAKDEGRNRVQVYQDDDHQLSQRREEMSKASLIRWALDEDRFDLFAQPISPLCHRGEGGERYEILLRMVLTDGTLLEPGHFIFAAEHYGLMIKIDRWVIRQSLLQLAERQNDQVNINLSGLSLNEADTVEFIKGLLLSSPVNPQNVCFEITETAAIRCLSKTKCLIDELKQIGCRFALDDFGSGLSSFNYLKQLPIDYLKIDGSFTRDILSDKHSRTMVEAVHQVAKSLNLKTVAEGVETTEALETLQSIGIDFVQGFAVGRPAPLVAWEMPREAAG
ncbi:MAG: EAL domain-containing protein, partial [Pseudomonadota bacterium]